MLSSLLVIIGLVLVVNELRHATTGVRQCSPAKAIQLMNHQRATVLDIREPTQFQAGHILSAHNIPVTHIKEQSKQLKKWQNRPMIVVANPGQPTKRLLDTLQQQGINDVYQLAGGISAWTANGLPLKTQEN